MAMGPAQSDALRREEALLLVNNLLVHIESLPNSPDRSSHIYKSSGEAKAALETLFSYLPSAGLPQGNLLNWTLETLSKPEKNSLEILKLSLNEWQNYLKEGGPLAMPEAILVHIPAPSPVPAALFSAPSLAAPAAAAAVERTSGLAVDDLTKAIGRPRSTHADQELADREVRRKLYNAEGKNEEAAVHRGPRRDPLLDRAIPRPPSKTDSGQSAAHGSSEMRTRDRVAVSLSDRLPMTESQSNKARKKQFDRVVDNLSGELIELGKDLHRKIGQAENLMREMNAYLPEIEQFKEADFINLRDKNYQAVSNALEAKREYAFNNGVLHQQAQQSGGSASGSAAQIAGAPSGAFLFAPSGVGQGSAVPDQRQAAFVGEDPSNSLRS